MWNSQSWIGGIFTGSAGGHGDSKVVLYESKEGVELEAST